MIYGFIKFSIAGEENIRLGSFHITNYMYVYIHITFHFIHSKVTTWLNGRFILVCP